MTARLTRRTVTMLALGATASRVGHAADRLSLPSDKVILSVSGRIRTFNKDGSAEFDRAMLESLGMESFETTTPWYNGPVKFEGVRMKKLMQAVGASGESVTAIALNDYTTDIPVADFERYGVLLALKRDGNEMPVRDKGPLFVVYPYDSRPELKSQKFYSRSAWQVAKLEVI